MEVRNAIFGLGDQVDQIQKALESGDPAEIAVRFVQLACMLFGLTSQCFTGDTLVSTEEGLRPIEEIIVGDYVWAEDTTTGEKELKEVVRVFESETDTLVHVTTESGTKIDTTKKHPFYVEGRGWCAAVKLEEGDTLRTKDGKTEVVADIEVEELDKAVTVYNLEVKDSHTYYVSTDEVLVHNDCKDSIEIEDIDLSVKPVAHNSKLQNFINSLYKGQGNPNQIGNGTTMDSIRYEVETGNPVEGKFHSQKGQEFVNGINKLLNSGSLDAYDETIARAIVADILDALSEK